MTDIRHEKPKVFIGSSSEGLRYARAAQRHLSRVAQVDVWEDGCFRQNEGNLEALLRMQSVYDFAVFVLTPDDEVLFRGNRSPCPRDNVLFEFGLFLGALGKDRCFAIASSDRSLRLPSDLQVMIARYEANRTDDNFSAATGVACDAIASQIVKVWPRCSSASTGSMTPASMPIVETETISEHDEILVRHGMDPQENAVVGEFTEDVAAWFHAERFTKAFPGVRGVQWIVGSEAVDRLTVLLAKPLRWVWEDEYDSVVGVDPIWWWRAGACMPISKFKVLRPDTVLIDCEELQVERVAAVNCGTYWQSFVYIECAPQQAIGPRRYSQDEIDEMIRSRGYADEEIGIFEQHVITRAEYDDGAAVIDGKVTLTSGSELRVRYLSPYNLLIASHESPINNGQFDGVSEPILDGLLRGTHSFEELVAEVKKLNRNPRFAD